MMITVDKPLVEDEAFRDSLYKLVRKHGYILTWVSSTEAELFNMSNVYLSDYPE